MDVSFPTEIWHLILTHCKPRIRAVIYETCKAIRVGPPPTYEEAIATDSPVLMRMVLERGDFYEDLEDLVYGAAQIDAWRVVVNVFGDRCPDAVFTSLIEAGKYRIAKHRFPEAGTGDARNAYILRSHKPGSSEHSRIIREALHCLNQAELWNLLMIVSLRDLPYVVQAARSLYPRATLRHAIRHISGMERKTLAMHVWRTP